MIGTQLSNGVVGGREEVYVVGDWYLMWLVGGCAVGTPNRISPAAVTAHEVAHDPWSFSGSEGTNVRGGGNGGIRQAASACAFAPSVAPFVANPRQLASS